MAPRISSISSSPASAPGSKATSPSDPGEVAPRRWPAYQKYDVDVRPSAIDGQGVFAAEPIPRWTKIGEIRGESISVVDARIRATRHERVMIVEISPDKAIDFHKSKDPMRYTNHSCDANARLAVQNGRVEFYSLRAISPGEEITVSYGETHHEGRLACRCGAPGCAGKL